MELKDFEVGTVVITANNDIGVVTKIKTTNPKNPIVYTNGKTKYKGNPKDFKAIIGIAEPEKIKEPSKLHHNPIYAPKELQDLNIDDKIVIQNRSHLDVMIYKGFNPRRPKNSLSIETFDGRKLKGPPELFLRKATAEEIAVADSKGHLPKKIG